jgi:kynurenine formamidase
MRKIVDLSHLIYPEMLVFPGTEQPRLQPVSSLEKDGFIEHKLTMCTHTGTHIDLPSHLSADGPTINQIDINHFMGKAAVIDCTGLASEVITREKLLPHASLISRLDFVILKTGWVKYWRDSRYFKDFPVLDTGAAQWLGNFKLKGIGIDAISVEPVNAKSYPVHRMLFKHNMLIVENLAHLENVGDEIFTFSCLPLKIKNGEGSPVRAVGIL